MVYAPAPGTSWGMRLWLFLVVLAGSISMVYLLDAELPWYLKLPLGVVILHGYLSAGAALKAAYVRRRAPAA